MTLSAVDGWNPVGRYDDILALDAALSKLERADPRAGRVVELRFFGGLLEDEIAEVLGVSVITVKRELEVARAWLMNRLQPGRLNSRAVVAGFEPTLHSFYTFH